MLNKKDFFLFFILSFCISSCVYGPETEKKSIFNYLNGKHYRQPAFAEAVRLPVFKEQIVNTSIKGRILLSNFTIPVKFEELILVKNEDVVLETTSGYDGSFHFFGALPNGKYKIKVKSEKYFGEKKVLVDRYDISNVIFLIEKRIGPTRRN